MRYLMALLLVVTRIVFAQQSTIRSDAGQISRSAGRPGEKSLAASLEAKVRTAWDAFKTRDKDKYATFLTDDFQAVEADGDGERSKARILREVEHSMYTDYVLQLFQVQPLGADNAFVTYEATIQFPAGSAVRYKRLFVGELWAEQGHQWKMKRYQETPVR
jgi:uncharacterized protein (TIGR02246 family)